MVNFLGNLHPAAVHFPVALVVVAAVAELIAGLKKDSGMGATGRFLITTGAVFAVLSVVLGFMASWGRVFPPEIKNAIDAHRISGIAAAGLALLATALVWGRGSAAQDPGDPMRQKLYRVVLVLALLATLAAGYFGAEVTHGPAHLLSK